MGAQYSGEHSITRQALRICEEKPPDQILPCPRPPIVDKPQPQFEFSPAVLPSRSPTNFIYTTFTSYATWLFPVLLFWSSSRAIREKQKSPTTSSTPTPTEDSLKALKLQRLMDRRKQEAERARCTRDVVLAFCGQVEVGLNIGSAEKRKRAEFSGDDEAASLPIDRFDQRVPWPRSPPSPSSESSCSMLELRYIPPQNKSFVKEEAFESSILSRSTSSCSFRDMESDVFRCASPWPSEDTVWDDSDSELEAELQECAIMLLESDSES
ncbi:hypothetical protein C8F04DRAFT_85504 [Mycena alexandri]|uniref:Uncharacterized protein n=1 Tax=Mycena alexandri TaxID=1745969 RepID=A0AAD6TEU2_9AGAR|nr:hypothetical protein C8F04DRAFT_85504 [Mycena alexandri]